MNFSKIAHPLFRLLEKESKFVFDNMCMEGFTCFKDKLTLAPMIVAPNWSKTFELMCYIIGVALGAV